MADTEYDDGLIIASRVLAWPTRCSVKSQRTLLRDNGDDVLCDFTDLTEACPGERR